MRDHIGYMKLARSLASAQNLTVTFEDSDNAMPRTDGKTLYLPFPDPLWSDKDWAIWNDACWHEIGHNFPENRDIFKLLEKHKIDTRSLFGGILNLVDDYRVDKSRTAKYYGMMEANGIAIPHHVQRMAKGLKDSPNNLADQGVKVIATMMTFDADMRGNFCEAMKGQSAYTEGLLDTEAQGWLEHLRRDYTKQYCNNKTGLEELELVRDIFINVFKMPPEENGDGQGDPQEGEGEGDEGDETKADSKPSGDATDGDGNGDKKGKVKKVKVDYEEMLKHPHSYQMGAGRSEDFKIHYTEGAEQRHYNPHTDKTTKIVDFTKLDGADKDRYNRPEYRAMQPHELATLVQSMGIHTIVGHARRLLQVETRKRPLFNQKKGRLDASKLYRVTLPESSTSEKIFRQKTESMALDTAVSVLVDYSGSMRSGDKIETAGAAAVALNELFRTLRVNCEILGFTERDTDDNATYVFKNFNTPVNDDTLIEGMSKASAYMCNNCDGDNILVAANRLKAQKQPRKVLVVLSDGSPAGGDGDVDGFTRDVIRKIESEREIDIIGIGIRDTNVKRLYKTSKVVDNIQELPTKLIETLENILLERKLK